MKIAGWMLAGVGVIVIGGFLVAVAQCVPFWIDALKDRARRFDGGRWHVGED